MNTKKILVIEDNPKHLADAKAFFADKPEYQVDYVSYGESVCEKLFSISNPGTTGSFVWFAASQGRLVTHYDGVITDLYLPWSERHPDEQPIGITIATLCRDVGYGKPNGQLPFVILTAGFHHGPKYQWVCDMAIPLGLRTKMITGNTGDPNKDADRKDWQRALKILESLMITQKS